MSEGFYASLPVITDFLQITDLRSYHAMPADWFVVIADIVQSTAAIAQGRYKDVNFVGAACIVALLNLAGAIEIPFVFGGDGATVAIPPSLLGGAREAMAGVQALASREYGFDLRVGIIAVAEINSRGHIIALAKFQVSPNYRQGMFTGGGLNYAEELIKDSREASQRYQIKPGAGESAAIDPNLLGLECRWENIANPRGEIITLIVATTAVSVFERNHTYRHVMTWINTIYDPEQQHPIAIDQLRLSLNPADLLPEARGKAGGGWRARLKYLNRIWWLNILGIILIRFKLRTEHTIWGEYPAIVKATTDYRKYDDRLRMVIAGTPQQHEALHVYLEMQYLSGVLVYGTHISERAVLTCVVYDRMGRQVHFVDGANGGYAQAARALKARAGALQRSVSA